MIAIRKFHNKKHIFYEAATVIQKKFRSWISCKILGIALLSREVGYRSNVFALLTANEEYNQELLTKLVGRIIKSDLKDFTMRSARNLHEKTLEINELENEIINLTREKECLSPRGILQGWAPEMAKTILEKKKLVMNLKLSSLFVDGLSVKNADGDLERRVQVIEEAAENRNKMSYWREIVRIVKIRFLFDLFLSLFSYTITLSFSLYSFFILSLHFFDSFFINTTTFIHYSELLLIIPNYS